eukprot:Lithocolla_globosa_v1_NODE_2707_length_1898_cov_11.283776.p4 type:complete len:114 gc:universal NODE_2707_length_1898_cov_11.283776:871-530(-)
MLVCWGHTHGCNVACSLSIHDAVDKGRVCQPSVGVKLEVDKPNKRLVELQERAHNTKVNIGRGRLHEGVRSDPGHGLSTYFCLIINTFDGEENFSERVGMDDIMEELSCQLCT